MLGPCREVHTWPQYYVNGYRFHTLAHGSSKATMNSGVCIKGMNYNDHESDYYGILEEVIELEYHNSRPKGTRIVLFKCDWFDPQLGRGCKVHNTYDLVEIHSRKRFSKYEPFILAQQSQQVYYVQYPSKKLRTQRNESAEWLAVCKIKARSTIDCPNVAYQEDDVSHDHMINIDDLEVRLCFETNEFEEILPSQDVDSYEDVEGEVEHESAYESELESLTEEDSIENEEMDDFDDSTEDDYDNKDDDDDYNSEFSP